MKTKIENLIKTLEKLNTSNDYYCLQQVEKDINYCLKTAIEIKKEINKESK